MEILEWIHSKIFYGVEYTYFQTDSLGFWPENIAYIILKNLQENEKAKMEAFSDVVEIIFTNTLEAC